MTTFYGPLTGTEYETAEARDHYERVAAQRLANDTEDDPLNPNYVGPTAEDVRRAHELVQNAERDKAKDIADERAAQVFVELHPEYVANARNAAALQTYLELQGKTDSTVTVEDLESAYETLVQRGIVDVDASKVAAQRKAEVREQAEEIRTARRSSGMSRSGISTRTISRATRTAPSEDSLYNMSLDELRSLAMREEE